MMKRMFLPEGLIRRASTPCVLRDAPLGAPQHEELWWVAQRNSSVRARGASDDEASGFFRLFPQRQKLHPEPVTQQVVHLPPQRPRSATAACSAAAASAAAPDPLGQAPMPARGACPGGNISATRQIGAPSPPVASNNCPVRRKYRPRFMPMEQRVDDVHPVARHDVGRGNAPILEHRRIGQQGRCPTAERDLRRAATPGR